MVVKTLKFVKITFMSRATPENVEELIQRFGPFDTSDICWGNSTHNVLKIDTALDQQEVSCDRWPRIYQACVSNPYQGWGEPYDSHDYVVFEERVFNERVTWVNGDYQDFDLKELLNHCRYGMVKEVTAKRLTKVALEEYERELRRGGPLVLSDGDVFESVVTRLSKANKFDPHMVSSVARKHLLYLSQGGNI